MGLDWDDVASVSRARTLARAIDDWHLDGSHIDTDGIRRTLTAYRAGGGTGAVREPADFGAVNAGFLNYLRDQLGITLDQPSGPSDARDAATRVNTILEHPLSLDTVHRLHEVIRRT